MVGSLDHQSDPDPAERSQRKHERSQPQFSTGWHYQDDFGLESPRL
jgi:hypothetical protein